MVKKKVHPQTKFWLRLCFVVIAVYRLAKGPTKVFLEKHLRMLEWKSHMTAKFI